MRVNRSWLGLVVLMLPTLLVAMYMTALLLALPWLSAGLGVTNVQQLWIGDSYGFPVAGLVLTKGALGERSRQRRVRRLRTRRHARKRHRQLQARARRRWPPAARGQAR